MKKWLLLLLTISGCFLQGQTAPELFEAGNEAYRNEDFKSAIEKYQAAADEKKVSAALYYNLGNAYYKTGQLAEAILHYERALALKPGDEDVLQNLQIAEKKTVDRFETMPKPLMKAAYHKVLLWLSPDGWARVSLCLFGLMLIGTAIYLFTGLRRTGFIAAVAGLIFGVSAMSLGFAHQTYRQNNQGAIVTSPSTYVKSGPSESAEDTFILHEGTKAVVTESYDDWRKIRLPDGKLGWVPANDIEVI